MNDQNANDISSLMAKIQEKEKSEFYNQSKNSSTSMETGGTGGIIRSESIPVRSESIRPNSPENFDCVNTNDKKTAVSFNESVEMIHASHDQQVLLKIYFTKRIIHILIG